jgi:uncharacterized protein YegP (UPF0339 family)
VTRFTPLKHARAAKENAQPSAANLPEPASMTFLIHEDNGGRYHWTIVADGGETLLRSASFGSYERANGAAGIVHRGASQASFEDRSDEPPPIDLRGRRDASGAPDRLDAER